LKSAIYATFVIPWPWPWVVVFYPSTSD